MDLANMRDICARQERILRFEKFDQETAWELGSLMVAEMRLPGFENMRGALVADGLCALSVRRRKHDGQQPELDGTQI